MTTTRDQTIAGHAASGIQCANDCAISRLAPSVTQAAPVASGSLAHFATEAATASPRSACATQSVTVSMQQPCTGTASGACSSKHAARTESCSALPMQKSQSAPASSRLLRPERTGSSLRRTASLPSMPVQACSPCPHGDARAGNASGIRCEQHNAQAAAEQTKCAQGITQAAARTQSADTGPCIEGAVLPLHT